MPTSDLDHLPAIADISLTVIGKGLSLSSYVATCVEIFRRHGLGVNIHALGSNVEGPLPEILTALEECHRQLHAEGIARIVTDIRLTTRIDRSQSIDEKISSLKRGA